MFTRQSWWRGGDGGNMGSEETKTLKESTLPLPHSVQSQEVGDRDLDTGHWVDTWTPPPLYKGEILRSVDILYCFCERVYFNSSQNTFSNAIELIGHKC